MIKMNDKAFRHVRNLIKDKFEMYYDFLNDDLFKTNILSEVYKKYSTDSICNGEADDFLIQLIDEFVNDNYVGDLNDINALKLHVKNIVTFRFSILSYDIQREVLEVVIDKVVKDVIDEKVYGIMLDEKIMNVFKNYVKAIYDELLIYIDSVLKFDFVEVSNNPKTFEYLKEELMKKLLSNKRIDSILDGKFDDEIITCYKEVLSYNKTKVKKYIHGYISDLEFPYNISEKLIISDIDRKIFESGEFDIVSLYNGNLDFYIVECGEGLKKYEKYQRALNYICELISKNTTGNYGDYEIKQFAFEIYLALIEKHNYSMNSICNGKHNELIINMYNRMLMKKNSVVSKEHPKKIKHTTSKKIISLILRWLLVLTILISVTATSVSLANVVDYEIASSKVEQFDNYAYTDIYSIDNERVKPTGKNAYEFYRKVASAGFDRELYGYLSFYKAYTWIRQDKLYIMDKILLEAKKEASYSPSGVVFCNELSKCRCFLEFVMRRLENMGCTEITKAKYKNALKEYEQAMSQGDKPMNIVSLETKKVIEEIMAMYRKYSKEKVNEFGDMLSNSVDMGDSRYFLDSNHSGRNV